MTKRSIVLVLAAVAGMTLLAAGLWADPPSEVGRLNLIVGQVSFQSGSIDEWVPATLNYPLTAGDRLWTDVGGRAEIHVGSSAIRLDSSTDFSFLNLDDQTVQIRLGEGSLNVRVRDLDPGDTFEVDTPNASVQLVSLGSYRIDVAQNGDTSVVAWSGTAETTAAGDTFDVPAGQSATVSGTDSIAYYTTDAPGLDQWDGWCMGRDQKEDHFASIRYVPRTMIGAEDLDEFGTWSTAGGYGAVWVPRVSTGWAPYRFGHWAWVEPWGWTWIDDAPWGFAPFHYGRWAFFGGRWAWVPGAVVARPVYAPALVVFVGGNGWNPTGGAAIGWFPLGPREVYVPPYRVSTAYVQRINITHVTNITIESIQRIDVNRVQYVNRMVPQGVTVVPQQSFAMGRPLSSAYVRVAPSQIIRAPVMGMTATVIPGRESIIARPVQPGVMVPRPRPELQDRRVYSRMAPPPPPVPFTARQQALSANPGRPVDPDELNNLRRAHPQRPPAVFVSPGARPVNPPPQQGRPMTPPPQGGMQRVPPQQGQQMTPPPQQGRPMTPPPQGGMQRVPPQQGQQMTPPPQQGQQMTPPPQQGRPMTPPPQGGMQRVPPQQGQQMTPPPQQGRPMTPPPQGGAQRGPQQGGGQQMTPPPQQGRPVTPPPQGGAQRGPQQGGGQQVTPPPQGGAQRGPQQDDQTKVAPPQQGGGQQMTPPQGGAKRGPASQDDDDLLKKKRQQGGDQGQGSN